MPKNPFTDIWQFLTATTSDYMALGAWRYLVLAPFWALLIGSLLVAVRNWREDPNQRTGRHLGTCGVRVLVGCMWFEGMLWKLPLPVSGGIQYWTEQMAKRAAFEWHRELVTNVLLPNLHLFAPLVFLAELTFACALILGLGVRLAGALGVLFVLHLWIGIYLPGEPAEWPWSYMFLAMLMFLFALYAAGRSLGVDALLHREVPVVRAGIGFWGRLFKTIG